MNSANFCGGRQMETVKKPRHCFSFSLNEEQHFQKSNSNQLLITDWGTLLGKQHFKA